MNYAIEGQVIGTEIRDAHFYKLGSYTVYVVEVTIDRVKSKLYFRYSELKEVSKTISKEAPDI